MSWCILDSSAAHTPPQFTPLTRRKTGVSPRHSRQGQTNGRSGSAACRPAVFHTLTALHALPCSNHCYTARIVCERLWVTGTRGSFTRAAELRNRLQPALRPRRSIAAVACLDDPGIGDPWSASVHRRHEGGLWLRRRVSASRTALFPSMGRAQHSLAKPRDCRARDGHIGGTQNFRDGLVRRALASKLGNPRLELEKLLPLPWHSRGIGPRGLGKSAVHLIGRRRFIHWHV